MKKQKGPACRQARRGGQAGQAILALILIMAVALAIGISVIQKSLVDVSTSTKVETSQRAFSAAEAGIEKALRGSDISGSISLENQSSAQVQDTGLLPYEAVAPSTQAPLEYPPLAKEEVAHVWLADPKASLPTCSSTTHVCYKQTTLDVYWGSSTSDKAALELTLVYYNGTSYQGRKWFLDHTTVRTPANNFEQVACTGYTLGSTSYQCKKTIGASPDSALPSGLMLLRARLLYNSQSQPFAVRATGTCGRDCSLPPQARIIASTGTSGETQRILQVFQIERVVLPYFDFAIFSAGEIRKQ